MGDVKIKIYWDGTAPGVAQHRLSLSAFGPALAELLSATRRIASGILKDALDKEDYGARGGRFAKEAARLDLEISSLSGSSLAMETACRIAPPPPGESMALFDDLPERAVHRLLDDIEAESKGRLSNIGVRRFLAELPPGLEIQRYEGWNAERQFRTVEIRTMALPIPPPPSSYFERIDGFVIGVGFEEGKEMIRVLTVDGDRCSRPANLGHVNSALGLRGEPVTILALAGPDPRVLWIRASSAPRPSMAPRAREDRLFGAWHGLLAQLAK